MNQKKRNKAAMRIGFISLIVNLLLAVLKLIAGIFGHSKAMVADAIHSLSDVSTDLVVIFSFQISNKPHDKKHNYGHGKFETLAALSIGLVLFIVGVGILISGINSVKKVLEGEQVHLPKMIALYAAVFSILIKEWLYQFTKRNEKKINSPAMIANAWHHRSDALSSLGTLIGIGGAIILGNKWRILDPIAAVIVSFFIFQIALSIIKKSINELLEISLGPEIEKNIIKIIKEVPGIKNTHKLKTRAIGNTISIDTHIQVNKSLNIIEAHDISTIVEKNLRKEYGKETFINIHIEPYIK